MALTALLVAAAAVQPALASLASWMPDAASFYDDLVWRPTSDMAVELAKVNEFKGMKFTYKPEPWDGNWLKFDAFLPTRTANNWWVPLFSVVAYFVLIPII